eukprot:4631043-Prymnesium_polylepis.2
MHEAQCQSVACVSALQMQRFVARCADAAHSRLPNLKVTVGAASLKWASGAVPRAVAHFWNDTALRAALPHATSRGTLDLYNVHFWGWMERYDGFGPCQESIDFWRLDKPTIFAELPSKVHSNGQNLDRDSTQLLGCALDNGFAGALFWAHNDPGNPLRDAKVAVGA